MALVKICGITNVEDALSAYGLGADLLGFVFVSSSPRYLTGERARTVISDFRKRETAFDGMTGLFLNEKLDTVIEIILLCGLDIVQLHGEEKPEFCSLLKQKLREEYDRTVKIIKTFKVAEDILPVGDYIADDYLDADYYLFDTFSQDSSGGTGKVFDWKVLVKNKKNIRKPFLLAGGLKPDNVAEAINVLNPYAVDVSSGVEQSAGVKNTELLKEFIHNAKK